MTPDRTPPAIQVNVNVTVTLPGGLEAVAYSAGPRPPLIALDTGPITVNIPPAGASGQRTGQVWLDPSTNLSYICATGGLSGAACCVLAKVYPGDVVLGFSPPVPIGDSGLRCAPVDNSSGSFPWQFVKPAGNLLPVPAGSGTGGNNYILGVWVKFDLLLGYTFQAFPFVGVKSTHTDCDGSGGPSTPLAAKGFPVQTAPTAPDHPSLAGALRDKTGRFAALPNEASFTWDAAQGGWVWVPVPAHCGTFTLLPCKDSFVLHCTVSEPSVLAPKVGGNRKPLQLTFEVGAQSGKAGKKEGFVLEVREGVAPAGRH